MTQADKVNMLGQILPEFRDGFEELRSQSLKYSVLLNRLSVIGLQNAIPDDKFVVNIGLFKDLDQTKNKKHCNNRKGNSVLKTPLP